jgi:hypothetical protein
MNKPLFIIQMSFIVTLLIFIFCWGCDEHGANDFTPAQNTYVPPTVITIEGQKNDTAYLYACYKDPGASVFEEVDGAKNCNALTAVSDVSGKVNTRLIGTYFIHYNAKDAVGKPLPTVTRTVSVVKNNADFLNGSYDVASTCTITNNGTHAPTVTTNYYTALVTTGSTNNSFELLALNIGLEKVIPCNALLRDKFIEVNYFSPSYASCVASGTLSPTKNTFTIESSVYPYSPKIICTCKNVYTKRIVLVVDNNHK